MENWTTTPTSYSIKSETAILQNCNTEILQYCNTAILIKSATYLFHVSKHILLLISESFPYPSLSPKLKIVSPWKIKTSPSYWLI